MGIYHEKRKARRARQPAAAGHVVKMRVVSAASLIFALDRRLLRDLLTAVVTAHLARVSGTLPSCLNR